MRVNVVDSALSVVLTVLLIPKYGINGYIAVIFTSEIINTLLSFFKLIYITDFKLNLTEWLIKPAFSVASAIMPVKLFAEFHNDTPFKLAGEIIISGFLYLLLLKITSKKEDIGK